MTDGEGYKKWIHMVRFSEVKSTDNPKYFEMYVATSLPWPVKDRHMKTDYLFSQSDDYSIMLDLSPPKTPVIPDIGYVVVPESSGYYSLKTFPNSKEVEITAEFFIDPGGFIPSFLVNIITDDISYYSFKKMRRYLLSEKFKNYETDIVKRRPWVAGAALKAP